MTTAIMARCRSRQSRRRENCAWSKGRTRAVIRQIQHRLTETAWLDGEKMMEFSKLPEQISTWTNKPKPKTKMKKSLILVLSITALSLSSYAQGFFAMTYYDGFHGISLYNDP